MKLDGTEKIEKTSVSARVYYSTPSSRSVYETLKQNPSLVLSPSPASPPPSPHPFLSLSLARAHTISCSPRPSSRIQPLLPRPFQGFSLTSRAPLALNHPVPLATGSLSLNRLSLLSNHCVALYYILPFVSR